jgi:hypothetical protein
MTADTEVVKDYGDAELTPWRLGFRRKRMDEK